MAEMMSIEQTLAERGMREREDNIIAARAYLAESRRRGSTRFAWTLMQWAADARMRTMRAKPQHDLFGWAV